MLFYIVTWLISSFINGLFFFVIFSSFVYWFYFKELPVQPKKVEPQFEKFILSQMLTEFIDKSNEGPNTPSSNSGGSTTSRDNLNGNNETMIALNMIFQFLFQELKDTKGVRRYIIRKLSYEFNELLTTKAAGKFLQKITARDFSLGTSFPIIHDLKLHSYEMDKQKKVLQELSVIIDIEYTNGFSLSIDADLILGRSAYVHIKILAVKGKARLQFVRYPFTHWNFSFIEDPHIEFDATSHFDGRQIPQLTQLILNQLRKSIRRKHTLPNYKCRFRPFFDQIYTQNLYKVDLDDILRKRSNSDFLESFKDSSTTNKHNPQATTSMYNKDSSNSPKSTTLNSNKVSTKMKEITTSYQYRKLCEKLGFDLTSKGRLNLKLKFCDRLPEALYSMNLPAANQPLSHQTTTINQTIAYNPQDTHQDTLIYITTSIDNVSMKSLMERQVCKDHWPLIKFELVKTSNDLGFIFVDIFFINRTEVVIKKLLPETPAAAFASQIKIFDIVHSVNETRVLSMKHLNKILQKLLVNTTVRFTVQRPCILLENIVMTNIKSVQVLPKPEPLEPVSVMTPPAIVEKQLQKTQSSKVLFSPKTESTTTASVPIAIPNNLSSTALNTLSTSLFPNTRFKIESLFSEKTKQRLFPTSTSSALSPSSPTNSSSTGMQTSSFTRSESSNDLTNSALITTTAVSPINATTTPMSGVGTILNQPIVTPTPSLTTASASCLVDYFCSVTERPVGEDLVLDLLSLLTNETNEEIKNIRKKSYFKITKPLKVERENVLSFDNVPISIDESYHFELNENTKYLNMFLWTNQFTSKMTKVKSLLIGYITIPLYEINVDCWNTTKGETQSTVHFSPVDELKASAISKLSHSHVISDHPGFDSCLSVGSVTINFQHELPSTDQDLSNLVSKKSLIENASKKQENTSDEEQITTSVVDEELEQKKIAMSLTDKIVNELIEQNLLREEFKKELTSFKTNNEQTVDDGSIHKFSIVNFNEIVMCEFCNKKIWLKKAYKCVYCNYTIHIKCYDKTIGKTICERFYKKNGLKRVESATSVPRITIDTDDPFEIIGSPLPQSSQNGSSQPVTSPNQETPRNMMTNFFSGIRQRRWTPSEMPGFTDDNKDSHRQTSKPNSFLNSFNLSLGGSFGKGNKVVNREEINVAFNKENLNLDYLNGMNSLDDNSSMSDLDEFKEVDTNEDKLYGMDLFEELPVNERRAKFEEQILKYQTNIDMMTRLKSDLEKELETCAGDNHKEAQIKSEIKHLEDQMKCVVFVMMQCQLGLETCIDTRTGDEASDGNEEGKNVV